MLVEFKADLRTMDSCQIYRKYILDGKCFLLEHQEIFELREEISKNFEINYNEIYLVGSGKLGFSIKPSRRFLAFNDDSDIDIAITSTELFVKVWKEALLFKKSESYWPNSNHFFKCLSQGWIRPDKLPISEYFCFTKKWWDFFNELTSSNKYGHYKIRGGLYHSEFFLKQYQTICIEQCIQEIS